MKTLTVTKKMCVIDDFMTETDVQYIEVVDKAKNLVKTIEAKHISKEGKNFKNKVVSIVENKEKNEVYINYEEIADDFLNNLNFDTLLK